MTEGKFEPRQYRAPRWIANAHVQTVLGRLLRGAAQADVGRSVAFDRERVELPDGDFVDLDYPRVGPAEGPLVLLMHGLEGSARRGYAMNVYRHLAARGVRAVGLNFRSCSGEPNRGARLYHSGDTEDILFVLKHLARRWPDARRGAIGFSLGGNALLKLLGELGERGRDLVNAAAAVSVPYDLGAGADLLDRSAAGRFYTRIFLKSLVAKAEQKADLIGDRCDWDRVRRARSFRDFDDAATAPIHGFSGAADYYTRSSSSHFIPLIRLPVLLIHSADDPFLPISSFPADAVRSNTFVEALLTERGGHVGFVEGPPWAPRFWAEETAASFLAAHLLPDRPDAG